MPIHWQRIDDLFGLEPSASGWDSEAIAYPYCLHLHDRLLMFYNGNGFGKSGLGVAEASIPADLPLVGNFNPAGKTAG